MFIIINKFIVFFRDKNLCNTYTYIYLSMNDFELKTHVELNNTDCFTHLFFY